jgi:U11/U12 small nuclear ribonucleoprotein SNRNP65
MSSSNQDQTTSSNDTNSNLNEILSNCPSELHKQLFEKIHGISSIFNINYALSPKLKYEYPPINNIIIENIVAALIACPKFYTQTLHLMNKMNLPCPLVPFVRVKRPSLSHNQSHQTTIPSVSSLNDKSSGMDIDLPSCQSESELESDTENSSSQLKLTKNKRNNDFSTNIQQAVSPKKVKLKSLIKSIQIQSTKGDKKAESVEDAFEKLTDTFQKTSRKISSFCTKTTETENILYQRAIVQSEFEGFAKIVPNLKKPHIDENKNV